MAPTLTRRQALAAGAAGAAVALAGGAGLVQAGVLPGRYRVGRVLGACDVGGPPPTTAAPGPLRFASFPSRRRGRPVGYGVAWPPGSGPGDRLAVCLLLHAAAGNERTPFERLRLHHHLAQATGPPVPPGDHPDGPPDPPGRLPPLALASADGRGSGWSPAAGDDPFGMLLDELLPLLSGLGLGTAPGQVGVLGWSMAAAAPSAWPRPTRAAWPAWPSRSTAAPTTRSPRPPGPGRRPPRRRDRRHQGLPRRRLLAAPSPRPAALPGRRPRPLAPGAQPQVTDGTASR